MELLIILLLILINGFFSMSEIAVVSARKSRLEAAARRGDKYARAAIDTANAPNHFLSTVQIGITLIGILTGIFSGENITTDMQLAVERISFLKPYSHTVAVSLVVIIITYFTLVLGELVPKRVGLTHPEGIAKMVALPMQWLSRITAPFVWLLTFSSDLLIRLFRIQPSADSKITEEEIKAIIREGTEDGEIQEIEQDIVERVFILGDRKVTSLMTHRNDVLFLNIHYDASLVKQEVNKEMHSMYPVYEDDKDTIRGVVLLKDLFLHINDEHFHLADYLKEPKFISEHLSAYEALRQFKKSGIHYGIITDEYGQTKGIVTMNDLLEALVGDVSEFYADEFSFTLRDDGTWLVDGQYPLPELLRRLSIEEPLEQHSFNTLSGLILHELQQVPKPGQKVKWQQLEFEVMDMDGARIDKVLIKTIPA